VIQSVAIWLALTMGADLYCGGISMLVAVLLGVVLLLRWRGFWADLREGVAEQVVSWRGEIWPYQWRIGVSWISGYLIFNMLTPVLFYFHGAELAGQMGMTWQLVNVLNAVAVSWSMSKGPRYGVLISEKRFEELDRLFRWTTAQAVGVAIAGAVALWAGLLWLRMHFAVGDGFLSVDCAAVLLLATVTNQIVFSQAVYLRAHKREPFLMLSVIGGLLTGLAIVLFGRAHGAWGACVGYSAVQVGALPFATLIWQACQKKWHGLKV
jgi:hypothetical protein